MKYPDYEQCLEILAEYGTPNHVMGHCRAVAMTARSIGRALNKVGYKLDLDLILAAGMLHDIARVEEDHQRVGAEYLESLGMYQVAAIVGVHMTYPAFNHGANINETDLVCLADRVCKFDKYVGADERMEYLIDKHGRTKEVEEHIYRYKHLITDFIEEIETIIGQPLNPILKADPDVPYDVKE